MPCPNSQKEFSFEVFNPYQGLNRMTLLNRYLNGSKYPPSARSFSRPVAEHDFCVVQIAKALERRSDYKFIHSWENYENIKVRFNVKGSVFILSGRPDITATKQDGSVDIYEIKTGRHRNFHEHQLFLYALLMLYSEKAKKINALYLVSPDKNYFKPSNRIEEIYQKPYKFTSNKINPHLKIRDLVDLKTIPKCLDKLELILNIELDMFSPSSSECQFCINKNNCYKPYKRGE